MIQFTQLPVQFDEVKHEYWHNGKQLRGITGIIKDYVFPDKYKGVSQRTLQAAADRGHNIHGQVEMIVKGFGYNNPAPEVRDLMNWANKNHVNFIGSEVLVSDLENFASSIDLVDDELNIYDIKTTSKLDIDYVRWQLSIYAYFLELNNPNLKVKNLYAIWLRDGKARVVIVERLQDEIVKDLLRCAAENLPWRNPLLSVDMLTTKDVAAVLKLEKRLAQLKTLKEKAEEEEELLKFNVMELMQKYGIDKWTSPNGRLSFTLTPEHTQNRFDSKAFEEKEPELYKAFLKESKVKASLRIKIKE